MTKDTRASHMGAVMAHEVRSILRQPGLCLVYAIFALMMAYAALTGVYQVRQLDSAISALKQEQETRTERLIVRMKAIYAGTEKPDLYLRADSPSWVGGSLGARYALLPTAPLAPLALGQSDLLSDQYKVSSYDKTSFIFEDPLRNPWHLLNGHFDVAFVIIYLLPLFIIALTYNLLSAEREDGTLRLLLAMPVSLLALLGGKTLVRGGIILVLAVLLPVIIAFATRESPFAYGEALLWAAVVCAYAIFWIVLAVLVNTWRNSSAFNAVVLYSLWGGLVFVMPVIINAVVTELHPAPSRIEMLTELRDVRAELRAKYGGLDGEDYHPELRQGEMEPGKVFIQGYQKSSWRAQRELKPRTDALLASFDEQLSRQQASVNLYKYLSPAVLTYEAMTTLAGTGIERYRAFYRQLHEFHNRQQEFFFPLVFSETRMTEDLYRQMPRYEWVEPPAKDRIAPVFTGLLGLLLPTLLLCWLAISRLKFVQRADNN